MRSGIKAKRLAPLLAIAALAGCATVPGQTRHPVRSAAQAIRIAIRACRVDPVRPQLWHARLNGGAWEVWEERDDVPHARALQVHVDAASGAPDGCTVLGLPETDYRIE